MLYVKLIKLKRHSFNYLVYYSIHFVLVTLKNYVRYLLYKCQYIYSLCLLERT